MNQPAPATEYIDRYLVDGPIWLGISRGIAGFFAAVCLLDSFRALITNQSTADFGWIDLSPCPPEAARGLLAFVGISLMLFCLTHRLPNLIRPAAILGVMTLVAIAVANAISIHRAIGQGTLRDGVPMPAHVVTLLMPVVFGVVRGRQYGPLRFPTGGFILLLSLAATAAGFSLGYVSSLSKFHSPQTVDAIVLMHPQSETAEAGALPHITTVQKLVQSGYSQQVVVLQDTGSLVSSLPTTDLRAALPAETEIQFVSITSENDLADAVGQQASLMFVGDHSQSARTKLFAQKLSGSVCFVPATQHRIDESTLDEVKSLWLEWISPFHRSVKSVAIAEMTK
ncbi:MAG: hypothetical protein AB8G99_20560 [Planctomycetaceae bacterium]